MVEMLRKLLEEIDKSNELTLFFRNLWKEDSIQAKLFFLHREQLFPSEDKVIFPYIFWSNVQEGEDRRTVLDIATELEEIKGQQAWKKIGFEKLLSGTKDLFAYYAIRVIRENADIKKLALDKEFSFRKLKQTLGDYKKINFDVLKQEEIESIPELDAIVKNNFMRFAKTFDPLKFIEALSSVSRITSTLPLMGIPHQKKLFEIVDVGFKEYTNLINEMYVLKLIDNFQTLIWCEHCLDTPQIFVSNSKIDPNHLKMRCLKCKKPMLISSIYHLDRSLKNCILFKDGLLAVALGWLFDQRKIKWDFSVHNKYENDFICETKNGKILLECKMHLIPENERSLRGQLEKDLNKLTAHVQTLSKEGIILKEVYLVYNYDLEDVHEDVEKILSAPKLERNTKKYRIKPVGFPKIVSILKEKMGSTD